MTKKKRKTRGPGRPKKTTSHRAKKQMNATSHLEAAAHILRRKANSIDNVLKSI